MIREFIGRQLFRTETHFSADSQVICFPFPVSLPPFSCQLNLELNFSVIDFLLESNFLDLIKTHTLGWLAYIYRRSNWHVNYRLVMTRMATIKVN